MVGYLGAQGSWRPRVLGSPGFVLGNYLVAPESGLGSWVESLHGYGKEQEILLGAPETQ